MSKVILTRLLLFFYLSSSTLSASHIHHDGLEHLDCKVCPIVKNIDSGDMPSLDINLLISFETTREIASESIIFKHTTSKGFDANAPPAHS